MLVSIISWHGQHERAVHIAKQVLQTNTQVVIVYSDPDPTFILDAPCQVIRRSNELFWEDKFKASLDATDDDLLVIHADCHCEDWIRLVNRCQDSASHIKNLGVWAPKIEGTYWDLTITKIVTIRNSDFVIAAMSDGIVFYLSPPVIKRMKQINYGNNIFGWGIDALFCASAFANKKLVLIDTAVHVFHPKEKRGYNSNQAKSLEKEFTKQFSLSELIQYELITNFVEFNKLKTTTRKKIS